MPACCQLPAAWSSPLQKQQHRDISGSPSVRLLTCTICSCKSQSIPTFLNCWNAFLSTVIYPQKNREQALSPSQNHILLNAATLPCPTKRPTQRKAKSAPPKPGTDGHSTYATDENFYFFLMTLTQLLQGEKHDKKGGTKLQFHNRP